MFCVTHTHTHTHTPGLDRRRTECRYTEHQRDKLDMDKLVTAYSYKRRTLRWPLVIFFDMLDISAYNAFVIWMALNPEWKRVKLQKRRLFLEDLGKALVRPQIERRKHIPRTLASAAMVRRIQEENAGALSTQPTEPQSAEPEVSV